MKNKLLELKNIVLHKSSIINYIVFLCLCSPYQRSFAQIAECQEKQLAVVPFPAPVVQRQGANTGIRQGANTGIRQGANTGIKIGTTKPVVPAKTSILTTTITTQLNRLSAVIKNIPQCFIKVDGHSAATKVGQQQSWDRVNAIIRFLVEKTGIGSNRFIFSYGTEGDANNVDITATGEPGPNTLPAPHPNLQGL